MSPEMKPTDTTTSQPPEVARSEPAASALFGNMSASQAPHVQADSQKAAKQIAPNLPVLNTLMAADRTLMSWTRTSLSLLSFGFTIYKILEGFQDAGGKFVVRTDVPRNAGLFLVGMGTLAMLMGTLEYWQTLRVLDQPRIFLRPRSPLIMALIMSISGVILFLSITAKVL